MKKTVPFCDYIIQQMLLRFTPLFFVFMNDNPVYNTHVQRKIVSDNDFHPVQLAYTEVFDRRKTEEISSFSMFLLLIDHLCTAGRTERA
ncbi:MAG: hypothetical protein J6W10_03815 [Kiritimatiellae bacterium]|nr:hypothetical protein [Kiritimatiellia bacterium]